MYMHLRYNFRIYPNAEQRVSLSKAFGCARTVYNDALRLRQDAYEQGAPFPKYTHLSKVLIAEAKKTPERSWLSEVAFVVLQQSIRDLDSAYTAFFASTRGDRKGAKVKPPRFKSRKDSRQSIRFTRDKFRLCPGGLLFLPKIGRVKVRWSRALPSEPSSVTVVRDSGGRYFASFVVQTTHSEDLPAVSTEVGIDLGLTHFAILSDGTKVSSPKFLRRAERRVKKAQRVADRKVPGSNNRRKAMAKVGRLHAKVADARRDHHHKLSTSIIRENQAVYVEDLMVRGLARTRLAKSIYDAGWSTFVGMLEYKASLYGRTFAKVDRFLPSTQTCHVCMVIDGKKPLNVRTWTCSACRTKHDRDVNAARVILAAGQAERLNACGGTVRPAA